MVDLLFSRPAGLLLGRRTRRMYMNEMDLIRKCARNANGKASQDLEMPKRKKQTTFLLCILSSTSPCNTATTIGHTRAARTWAWFTSQRGRHRLPETGNGGWRTWCCRCLRLGPVQTPTMLSYSTCLVGDDEYKWSQESDDPTDELDSPIINEQYMHIYVCVRLNIIRSGSHPLLACLLCCWNYLTNFSMLPKSIYQDVIINSVRINPCLVHA